MHVSKLASFHRLCGCLRLSHAYFAIFFLLCVSVLPHWRNNSFEICLISSLVMHVYMLCFFQYILEGL